MDFLSILTQAPVIASAVTASATVVNNFFKIKGVGAFCISTLLSFAAAVPTLNTGKAEYLVTGALVTLIANGIFKLVHAAAK